MLNGMSDSRESHSLSKLRHPPPNNITYYKMSRDYKYYKTCISKSISTKREQKHVKPNA